VGLDVRAQPRPRDGGRHGLEIMFEGVGICEQCRSLKVIDVHGNQLVIGGTRVTL
jgi:hypothetical protein